MLLTRSVLLLCVIAGCPIFLLEFSEFHSCHSRIYYRYSINLSKIFEEKVLGENQEDDQEPVSYTHLDVYKRQPYMV